jgi:hypothetical protein
MRWGGEKHNYGSDLFALWQWSTFGIAPRFAGA